MDPFSEYGSGSRKLLNTDPIRIRIQNNGTKQTHFSETGNLKIGKFVCDCERLRNIDAATYEPGLPKSLFNRI